MVVRGGILTILIGMLLWLVAVPAQADEQAAAELADLDRQMSEQATEQWLRKIPDDPGGLLRRKFLLQCRERGGVTTEADPW